MKKQTLWTSISTIAVLLLALTIAQPVFAAGGNVTLTVLDSNNAPLNGVNIYYNDYSNHWVLLGTTAGGNPVMASFADGTYNFKAIKDHSQQVASVVVSGTGGYSFKTDKYTVHVKDSTTADFPGIAVAYNDYSNHYLSMGNTNSNGNAFIELFPGTYTFRATKDHSTAAGTGSSNYVEFQTDEFTVHVKHSNGDNFEGIAVAYNDYSNHYLSMGTTDSGGNATIELFPGDYKFRATKDHSTAVDTSSSNYVEFQTALFTVHVKNSGEADFEGIAAAYNDYSNHYLSMGNTDGDGNASIELFPGTYTFRATKDHTYDTGDLTNDTAGTEATIEFQTAEAIAYVKDCNGTPLAGFKVTFNDYSNHWLNMGTTGVDGKASIELFPGTRTIRAWIDYTYEVKDLTLTLTESSVEFNPTKVNWQYSGTVKYNDYSNHWKTMTSPFYLFPGTYAFRFDGVQQDITISGCAMEGSVLVINLKDSYGNGVAGGTAHLGVGGWPVIGTTDANGVLLYFHNSNLGNMRIRMDAPFYGGSQDSLVQDTSVNSIFDFQTSQVVIQLKDSAGNLTNGGVVQAGAGGWPGIGTTGDDGTGTLYHEHFAGTFKYRMGYHGSSMEIQQDVSIPFIFQTTKAVIRLEDHNGDPLDGGKVLQGIGGWPQIGVTGDGAPGEVWYELFPGTHTFRMSYNYGTEEKSQDIGTPVVFQTALVTLQFSGGIQHQVGGWPAYTGPLEMLPISHGFRFTGCGPSQILAFTPTAGTVFEKSVVFLNFKDSGGAGLAGADFKYRFGWGDYTAIGTTDASGLIVYGIDGLHTNTKFNVTYNGASVEKEQNIAANSCVDFQTVPVSAELWNHDNSTDLSNSATFEYRYGWGDFTALTGPTELLPVNTKVKVTYAGASVEKEQNAASSPDFLFNTALITAVLKNHDNTSDLSSGATFEYRYGWGDFTPLTGPTELLPVNTKVKVTYAGASVEKEQNANANPDFVFNTVSVTASLLASNGSTDLTSSATFDYRYGWGDFTPLTGATELLPVNIKVKVTYAGTSVEKEQNANSDSSFDFQTGSVTSTTCTQYRYDWGGYMTFTSPMELLSVSTKFADANGPDVSATPISGGTLSVSCP